MIEVKLADGQSMFFSEDLSDEQIKAEIRKLYPEPRPETLEPGKILKRRNGAKITHDEQLGRYFIRGLDGKLRALRNTLAEALDLADSLEPPPPPRRLPERPQPSRPDEPVTATQLNHRVDQLIRRDEAQRRKERIAAQRQKRFRNRGTLG